MISPIFPQDSLLKVFPSWDADLGGLDLRYASPSLLASQPTFQFQIHVWRIILSSTLDISRERELARREWPHPLCLRITLSLRRQFGGTQRFLRQSSPPPTLPEGSVSFGSTATRRQASALKMHPSVSSRLNILGSIHYPSIKAWNFLPFLFTILKLLWGHLPLKVRPLEWNPWLQECCDRAREINDNQWARLFQLRKLVEKS